MLEYVSSTRANDELKDIPKKEVELRDGFIPLFSFIADTHLNAHQYNLKERANDMLHAFEECLDLSRSVLGEEGFVIHGGDVFNSPIVRPFAIIKASEVIEKCGMNIFSLRGNHDGSLLRAERSDISLQVLDKTCQLSYIESDVLSLTFPECVINFFFQSHVGKDTMRYLHKLVEDAEVEEQLDSFNILVIHSIVEGMSAFGVEIPRDEFKSFIKDNNIDLVLIGHFHKKVIDDELRLLCPGSPECLDIDQAEIDRGFFIIGVEGDKLSYQWIRIQTRKMNDLTIDLGDISNTDVNVKIKDYLSRTPLEAGSIARFNLIGRSSTNPPVIDRSVFKTYCRGLLKVIVNNKITYEEKKEKRKDVLSTEDAINKALKDLGFSEHQIRKYTTSMISISEEASLRKDGWREEIRNIIKDCVGDDA